ncbi:MAG: tetratricopeptide repeat protein, partial [Rhizobacter sp.]|nr:tetratricopeptide repeat protein [Chlorobiales bacterium]
LLGLIHDRLGNVAEAFAAHFKSLALSQEIHDAFGEAMSLTNIGIIYKRLGEYFKSLEFQLLSLKIYQSLNHERSMSQVHANIGTAYQALGDNARAFESFFAALQISERTGDKRVEMLARLNISAMYLKLGEVAGTLDMTFIALKLAETLGDKRVESALLTNIGEAYERLEKYPNALTYHFKALKLREDCGLKLECASSLMHIGSIYAALDSRDAAADYFEKSLVLCRATGSRESEAKSLVKWGKLFVHSGDMIRASRLLLEAIQICEDISAKELLSDAHRTLSEGYKRTGHRDHHRKHRLAMQRAEREVFSTEARQNIKSLIVRFEVDKAREDIERSGIGAEAAAEAGRAIEKATVLKVAAMAHQQPAQGFMPASEPMPEILVRTFGSFSVSIGEHELSQQAWQRKKTRDVFKVLLIHYQHAVSTDELQEWLWPESDGKKFEASLMKSVSQLRKALEPDLKAGTLKQTYPSQFIRTKDRTYTLDLGEGAMIDFLSFKQMISEARAQKEHAAQVRLYASATELYQGEFLKENLYDDWATYERETLKESYLDALSIIAVSHLESNDCDDALHAAEKILACDAASEKGFELLLTALHRKGERILLQKTFARCAAAFKKELGALPPEKFKAFLT